MRALFSITRIALSKATNSYQQNPLKAIAFSSERMAGERQAQIDAVIAEFGGVPAALTRMAEEILYWRIRILHTSKARAISS